MKKKKLDKNYLEKIPVHPEGIPWKTDENGIVTLEIESKGAMNRIAQKLFKKPRVSYIHLDKTGSFVWPLIDGKKTITELGKEVDAHFGEEAHPLYERLATFFNILDSYKFISWIE
ncbi:MAG: PqqD family protein [Clostridia bacterium]|nr:PqqD family protein [Clostridia bacterium]